MPTYISLLRGINVGGHAPISMHLLRRSYEALGFKHVSTYLQSGNVIFATSQGSPRQVSAPIAKRILGDFGLSVSIIVRTPEDLMRIVTRNPFLSDPAIDQTKLHVTFLSQAPARAALSKLAALDSAPDQSRCIDHEIYLYYCPNGYGRTELPTTQ